MTAHRDLKNIIRARQMKTGESYTAARVHVMRERAVLLGLPNSQVPTPTPEQRVEAIVFKVSARSARVRILGEEGQVTLRSTDVWKVVPAHLVSLAIKRRWTWRGDAYASGKIEDPRIDVEKLGLEPLPLHGGGLDNVKSRSEPYSRPDPYAPLWKRLTARPRPAFVFDGIAWGAFPGVEADENLPCEAAELVERGDLDGARGLLMEALGADLRCLDAHAQLGSMVFDRWPERAMMHYELGMRIGELSLPAGFDGLLIWGHIYNRPFLRCLQGYGLCLWRLGRLVEARGVFARILALSPNDNQGVRFCWEGVRKGLSWEQAHERDGVELSQRHAGLH